MVLKRVNNQPAGYKTGQLVSRVLNRVAGFITGRPVLKQAAGFKTGQVLNPGVTYILSNTESCKEHGEI